MRTEPSSPLASAFDRLRAPAGRVRRWLASRGTSTRVALLVAVLGSVGAAGYLALVDDPSTPSWAWIFENRKLSQGDVRRISEALDSAGIVHVTDPSGQVGVRPDRKSEALAVLAKRNVSPLSIDDLSREDEGESFWDDATTRARKENARQEKKLKILIEGLDPGIAEAHVDILRVRSRGGLGASTLVSSFIYLQTEGGRRLGSRVIDGIETFLRGAIPDLKPGAITVVDQLGYKYLSADNPQLKEQNQTHAQEEKWRDSILEGLQHIPSVGVSVLLETFAAPPAPPDLPPAFAAEVVRPNGPIEISSEPAPGPVAPPTPRNRANVWVRIPRSFYLRAFQVQSPGRHPASEDLDLMQATTKKLVRDAVEITIPREILGEINIDNVQDDLANARALLMPTVSDSIRPWPWLILSGAVGGPIALLALATLVRLATRRPTARPSRSPWRPGFVADGPAGPQPGPAERVRELIRLNPEAAAGVLQRWIGQGGALE